MKGIELEDIDVRPAGVSKQQRSDSKTELIMFLTPHIVVAPSQLAALSADEKARSEIKNAVTKEQLDRFLDSLPVKDAATKDALKFKPKKPEKNK